uniref:Glutathione peroxidase n=1 Tax=Populus euphratica TaxID=75702 RepID=A0A0G3EIQ3_POPEU|nr:glutathione peroxidase [Populus euphratica]
MASLTLSATFHSLSLPGVNIQSNKTSPTMASFVSAIKSSPVSSKSAFLQHGFSLQSPNLPGLASKAPSLGVFARATTEKSHDFTVKDIDGKGVPLSKFKGVLLIVNVASKCGFASTNYSELTRLYEKYKTEGFEILAFLCNQFGGQEPGSNPEIKFACAGYKAEFPILDKVGVDGPSTAPVYQFLKSSAGGFSVGLIKWNLEKFLVDKNGKVVERYPLPTSPFQIEKDIQKLILEMFVITVKGRKTNQYM